MNGEAGGETAKAQKTQIMPKLSGFSGEDVICILVDMGFLVKENKNLRVVLHRGGIACAVPLLDELPPETLSGVLRQAGLSAEEFLANK